MLPVICFVYDIKLNITCFKAVGLIKKDPLYPLISKIMEKLSDNENINGLQPQVLDMFRFWTVSWAIMDQFKVVIFGFGIFFFFFSTG